MKDLKCPACAKPMVKREAADFTHEECSSCGTIFLEPGELNSLATPLAGDIEYCSLHLGDQEPDCPVRECPACAQPMAKTALLQFSDIIFDRCGDCGSFLLDRGEAGSMNRYLDSLSGPGIHEELRTEQDEYLVRVDKIEGMALVPDETRLSSVPSATATFQVSVYFSRPLGLGLHVVPAPLSTRILTALGLYDGEDVRVGAPVIDSEFLIRAQETEQARLLLSHEEIARLLEQACALAPLIHETGRIEINDRCVVYKEGPYLTTQRIDMRTASAECRASLLALVKAIESVMEPPGAVA